jgi:hypothetical protein
MSWPSNDPSIKHEPHFQQQRFESEPGEGRARTPSAGERGEAAADDDVEHNVWEEPTLAADLAGVAPEGQVTYARWLDERIAATSYAKSLGVTLLLIACAGPWGVVGALFGGGGGGDGVTTAGIVTVAIIGPITEEIMKIALALWVVEKRPYLFKSIWQILICAAAGGLLFGVIENLLYLNVYILDASRSLARWRWTVCVGLHVNCSFVAGVGLARIWDRAIRTRTRPELGYGMGWFATAMMGHGLYNLGVTVAEFMGWLEF